MLAHWLRDLTNSDLDLGKKKAPKQNIVFNKGYFASCVEKTTTSYEVHCYDVGLTDVDVKNFFTFLEKYFFGDSTEESVEENNASNNTVVKEPFSPAKGKIDRV